MKKNIYYFLFFIIFYIFLANSANVFAAEMQGGDLSGEIKLTADTVITSTIKVPSNKTLTLDLNGHVLKNSTGERAIVVNVNATLIIKDSNPTRAHYGTVTNNLWVYNANAISGTEIKGGIITGGTKSDRGGAIFNKGIVTMNGGTIAGCKTIANSTSSENSMQNYPVNTFTNGTGGAVFIDDGASFTMNGGAIKYCSATPTSGATESGGGAVFVDANANKAGTFTMNGGTISNCNSLNGGAVYLHANLTTGNTVENAAVFNMTAGTINDCHSTTSGGAVYVNATQASSGNVASVAKIDMSGGTIANNSSDSKGGAIYLLGKFNMSNNAQLTGNTTKNTGEIKYGKKMYSGAGGAVSVQKATANFVMNGGTISDSIAGSGGAVVVSDSGSFSMEGGKILNCSANSIIESGMGNGGAVYVEYATFTLNEGTIQGCSSTRYGGAINLFKQSKFVMNSGVISECIGLSAGGIYALEATVFTMNDGEIINCRAESEGELGNGGALYIQGCTFNFNKGTLEGNYAKRYGGAININKGAEILMNGECKIINNTARYGGAIAQETGDCQINLGNKNILIKGNSAIGTAEDGNGGAIFIEKGVVNISACTMEENNASAKGGTIYLTEGSINMSGGSISKSTATNGGAIYMNTGNFQMTSGSIVDNTATNDGGAVRITSGNAIIGLESCKGNNSSHSHPIVRNNKASEYGGGISISGGNLNMYCGALQGNLHMGGTYTNNMDQGEGVVNVYGGSLDGGIAISGGTFTDYTKGKNIPSFTITYYSNNNAAQTRVASVTSSTVLSLLGNVFETEGKYLIGWKTDKNSNEILYVGSIYTIDKDTNFYAVWGEEEPNTSYVVNIPDTVKIDEIKKNGTLSVTSVLKYFINVANLTVNIEGKGKLTLNNRTISYELKDSNNGVIENGDVVATFSNNDQSQKNINIEVTGQPIYAGTYTDILTFNVTYNNGLQ